MKLLKKAISTLAAMAMCSVFAVNSITPDETVTAAAAMRDMTSQEVVSDMGIGWNLGNTFDSYTEDLKTSPSYVETLWGNPTVTKELIQSVKAEGFKTIRLPVTWMSCIDSSNNINSAFMARVQEVVDYCINEGLYVILNVHHDGGDTGGWLRNAQNDSSVFAKYETIWQQIALNFADYSDYLVFESMNEVGFNETGNPTSENYNTLNKLNQLFVDTVRGSGSNNASRHLLISGYFTDTAMTCDNRFVMPTDSADRSIVSIHYYSPSTFCVAPKDSSWGYASTWGTADEQKALDADLDLLKTRFVDAGTPVIIGEYGVLTQSENGKEEASIVAYLEAVAEGALERGICPILWDSGNGGDMQYFNRTSKTWNSSAIDAVYAKLAEQYSTGVTTPVTSTPTVDDYSKKVTLQTDEYDNLYVDLSPYVGKLITGVGFTVNGDTFAGNGGVLLGLSVYSDKTTWGGAWKGVQAPFLGQDNGQLTKYTFDADNEESVDPKEIMYDGQTMTFSINWTYPAAAKDSLTLGDEVILYFSGSEKITTTTTNILETKFEESVTAVVGKEVDEDEGTDRPTLRVDLSPYKGNKLVGVKFNMTGTHGSGNGAISYNVIDEASESGTAWEYTAFDFTSGNEDICSVLDSTHMEKLSYDFLSFNIWYESDDKTSDDYSFSPDVTLYFEEEVVIQPTEATINPDLVTMYGNVNCDNSVDIADVVSINTYLINKELNILSDVARANSDCVRDGEITSSDSALIMNYVAMLIDASELGK